MSDSLPASISQILTFAAVLMFLVAGGRFDHSLADLSHSHNQRELVDNYHHHAEAEDPDPSDADRELVHCGANLVALTGETEASPRLMTEMPGSPELHRVSSKSDTVDPPPPRKIS